MADCRTDSNEEAQEFSLSEITLYLVSFLSLMVLYCSLSVLCDFSVEFHSDVVLLNNFCCCVGSNPATIMCDFTNAVLPLPKMHA